MSLVNGSFPVRKTLRVLLQLVDGVLVRVDFAAVRLDLDFGTVVSIPVWHAAEGMYVTDLEGL